MNPGTPLPWEPDDQWDENGETAYLSGFGPQTQIVLDVHPQDDWTDQDGVFYPGVSKTEAEHNLLYAVTAANLHPRLLDTLHSAVLQLEAVPEDVPGWMQRTHLCRRARELAAEAGEAWAMGNGETPDSGSEDQ